MNTIKINKKISLRERHIRWNWEKSPDNPDMTRYFFVIVDDKGRDQKLEKILSNFRKKTIINHPFEFIRKSEGQVVNSGLRYLFAIYDSGYSPNLIDFFNVSAKVIMDNELYERKVGNVEDYVERLFG